MGRLFRAKLQCNRPGEPWKEELRHCESRVTRKLQSLAQQRKLLTLVKLMPAQTVANQILTEQFDRAAVRIQ
jgi:hypothetical protein